MNLREVFSVTVGVFVIIIVIFSILPTFFIQPLFTNATYRSEAGSYWSLFSEPLTELLIGVVLMILVAAGLFKKRRSH